MKITKQDKIDVLKKVRNLLVLGEYNFVCLALKKISDIYCNQKTINTVEYLLTYVSKSLDRHFTLSCWQKTHLLTQESASQQDRIDWVNWMIDNAK